MNWIDFKTQLAPFPNHHLQFQIAENTFVHPSFHITEIKQANISSVDCGGKLDSWNEIVVQLWEPQQLESNRSMQVNKAFAIIDLVESKLPLQPFATVKIEFGNSKFETRQMLPQDFEIIGDEIIVQLQADKTQCKAMDRGQTCGEPKQKIQLSEVATACCAPNSGCC
jgi:hypothetical protein